MNTTVNPKAYRLPLYALPRRYDIQIDARLGREDFHGKLDIQLDIKEPRETLELHAFQLQFEDVIVQAGGKTYKGKAEPNAVREMATLRFDEALPAGPSTLSITYSGKVSKAMEGLYLANDGAEQCLCTQCEATDARDIFPCWDEPAFKAQFAWEVTTAPDATVLANGPLLGTMESPDGASKTWKFAPTKPMSSYLLGMVIGDVASTPERVVAGTPLRVWAMRGKEHMGDFALRYTERLLPYFNDYFGVPFHFDKYDQAAVPGFSAGAMENSGLVIFRQRLLIMDPETASWEQEKYIAAVVAHEFAHMWFGNLVTMQWWDDLWLKESFAEWMAHKALNTLNPEYDIWTDFVANRARGKIHALDADALESTHPIYSPVETPEQATELFDLITYEKGCSVMRMLESFLGEEAFRAGLRTYMQEFAEGNARGADLWRHLEQASGQPVPAITESWIKQPGHPVLGVSLESEGSPRVKLSQRRFFSSPGMDGSGQLWQVPVIIHYGDDAGTHEQRVLFSEQEETVTLEASGQLRWCYANADEIGFYRQHLDDSVLAGVLANLDALSPVEQVGLLVDQWALVRSGAQQMSRYLDALSALAAKPRSYNVTERLVEQLGELRKQLEQAGDEAALLSFRRWVGEHFQGRMQELGFEPRKGESTEDTQSRVGVIEAMTLLAEDRQAVEESTKMADREAEDPASIDPNLSPIFVYVAARFGDAARLDRYVELFQRRRDEGASPQVLQRILDSFVAFRPPELVRRVLGLVDEQVIPQESVGVVLTSAMRARHAQAQAWDYVREHLDALHAVVGDTWIGRLVETTGYLPASERDNIVSFYNEKLQGVADQSFARALERLDQATEFRARTTPELVVWFKGR